MSGQKTGSLSYNPGLLRDSYNGIVTGVAGGARYAAGSVEELQRLYREQRIKKQLERLRKEAARLTKDFDELNVLAKKYGDTKPYAKQVAVPDFSALTNPSEMEDEIDKLFASKKKYEKHVSAVIKDYIKSKNNGLEEALKINSSQKFGSLVTAEVLLGAIENEQIFASNKKNKEVIKIYCNELKMKLEKFRQTWGDAAVSPGMLKMSAEIGSSTTKQQAQDAFQSFESETKIQTGKIIKQRKKEEALREIQKKISTSEMLGTVISTTLEDMGYVVTGIDNTCFTEKGQIFARHNSFTDHMVKLTIDRETGKQIFSEPVRVKTENSGPTKNADADKKFDDFWCSKNQIGQFRAVLKNKHIDANFIKIKPEKEKHVVSHTSADEQSQVRTYFERFDRQLQERQRKQ